MGVPIDHRVHIEPYQECCHTCINGHPDKFIIWRRGTGDNIEILNLQANDGTGQRHGVGSTLLVSLLLALKDDPPYATVFGFTRACNAAAQAFYRAMGFDLTLVAGVYDDGAAYLFSQRYDRLCEIHHVGYK